MEHLAIVTPCYNEDKSIITFLKKLESNLLQLEKSFSIIVVDDCSNDDTPAILSSFNFSSSLLTIHVLRLKFNVGHQSAIFQGLLYAKEIKAQRVIVMDSDGEDNPEAIPILLKAGEANIIEVKRGKRKESLLFRVLYKIYKLLFLLITAKKLDYGNFCLIDQNILERATFTSFIHFPAYLLKQKASRKSIEFDRDRRISGESKMGHQGLLIHAFKSFIEFAESFLMMFLKLFAIVIICAVLLIFDTLYKKYIIHTAILGWTSTVILGLLTIAIMCLGFFVVGILLLNLMHQQNGAMRSSIYSVVKS
jgi:polyisoprenyl-phosphate glycosyltransferase